MSVRTAMEKDIYSGNPVLEQLTELCERVEHLTGTVSELSSRLTDHLVTQHGQPVSLDGADSRRESPVPGHQILETANKETEHEGHCESVKRKTKSISDMRLLSMRRALRQHIISFVEELPFAESELGDVLISEGCLTEDECAEIRTYHSKMDQVRNLIRIIKGRSFSVLTKFLAAVGRFSPDLHTRVMQTYDTLKLRSVEYLCPFCMLKQSVDIKQIADQLWSIDVIDDKLYDEIAQCEGHNIIELWDKLAKQCNQTRHCKAALEALACTLKKSGVYQHALIRRLQKEQMLVCRCEEEFSSGEFLNNGSTKEDTNATNDFRRPSLASCSSNDSEI